MQISNTFKILVTVFSLIILPVQSQSDLVAKIEAMAKVGACYSPDFSKDASEILFISNMSGSPQIWKVSREGGWPEQLTNFNDPVTGAEWSASGKIAFQLSPGGGLNSQIYLMNSDGTEIIQITEGGNSNNWLGDWNDDGSLLSYSSNKNNPSGMDAYLYNLNTGTSELVVTNQGIGGIADISSDSSQFLLWRMVNRGSNDMYLIDSDRSEILLTEHEGPGSFFANFGKDNTVYMGSNLDRDLVAFGWHTDGEIKILEERENSELEYFIINKSGTLAILVWNEGGENQVQLYDLLNRQVKRTLEMPLELAFPVEFSPDDNSVLLVGSGSNEPTNIWIYDLEKNVYRKISHSPHPGVNLEELITPKLVRFESFDGLELSGWLYEPAKGSKPYPTVLSFHGGPEGQSRPYFSYTFQALLSQGIAVFSPNVRGSSGFGKEFVNLDNGALRVNGVQDIRACVNYVVNSGFASPDKLGIMGGSYGGYMVMAGVTEFPEMFAAAANLFGVVNFKTFFENTEPWMAAISKIEYGDPDTEAEMLRDLSPIHKLDKVKTPTIVLHGANDTNVPVVEAEQVVENLESRGVATKYVLFPDEGHGWRKTPNKVTSTVEIVNWFKTYLKGEE